MFLRIENLAPKKLLGKQLTMSFANDRTAELWGSFMPLRRNIPQAVDANLYSMQVYPSLPTFQENLEYVKWAAVEVPDYENISAGLEPYLLQGGLYAVFLHQGPPSAFQKTIHYIFQEWLPASGYQLDQREHFEVLGDKYKNNQADSEEEIWIPISVQNPVHNSR